MTIRYPLFLSFLLAFSVLQAQSPDEVEHSMFDVDNLLDLAKLAATDSEKEDIANQSLSIARSIRYDGGIVRASMVLGETDMRMGKTEEALQHYLEAEAKVQGSGNKATLMNIYSALGDLFFQEKLYSGARRYYSEVLNLKAEDYQTMEKLADAYLFDAASDSTASDSSEYFYKKLIVKYKEEGNNPRLVQIYQKLAKAYDQKGNAWKGLYYYLPIEDLVERFGNSQERAILYNNLGRQYAALRDYGKAIEYFKKSELQCVYIPCEYPEVLYANMGIALHNTGNTQQGIEYLLKARAIVADHKDHVSMANLEHLMAGVYFSNNDLYNALAHNDIAIKYARETKQATVLAEAYKTAADVYHQLYDFEKAFSYYRDYLNLLDTVRFEEQGRQQRLYQQRTLLASAEGQIKYLLARQNFKELELSQVRYEREKLELLNKNLELETRRKEDQLVILQKQTEVDQAKQRELILETLRARQELRLAAQQLDAEKQGRLIADLKRQEEIDRALRAQSYADSTNRAQELEILRRDKDITDLQLSQQDSFKKFVYGLGALLLVILSMLGAGWWFARRTNARLNVQNRKIHAQNKEIEEERHKSDGLLRNILPEEIATELKTRGYATPRLYESATVVFTDFINFTQLSLLLTPDELINELDECFLAFDEICEKHGLEKIKTIGDAFMCAGGLPVPNDTHAVDAVRAALEMSAWLEKRNREHPKATFQEMRIGIHTGPVVAGVIGKNKFAYDIWGDAVNIAARLEQTGESRRINISSATAEAVKGVFRVSYRGKKEVHNKGLVDMYFIEGEV